MFRSITQWIAEQKQLYKTHKEKSKLNKMRKELDLLTIEIADAKKKEANIKNHLEMYIKESNLELEYLSNNIENLESELSNKLSEFEATYRDTYKLDLNK